MSSSGPSPRPENAITAASATSEKRSPLLLLLIGAIATVATVEGWRLFFFLTDDAYIAFRYVSNSMLGRGLVWNPAPFRPVEGYTSFLWVAVLRVFWTLTGVEPPESANVLSLLCGLLTLLLVARLVLRMSLPPSWEKWRLVLLTLVLAGTISNRTFLTWLSSGLETGLFNLLFIWWVYEGVSPTNRDRASWAFRLSLSAALSALCRPDGMLMVLATAVILVLEPAQRKLRTLATASPLLLIPIHLVWRWFTYHDWVPNTYRAKYVAAWPESGVRYFACFLIEYGAWWWLLLAIAYGVHLLRNRPEITLERLVRLIPIAVLVAHLGYYTIMIGGDHFEYRVYSHLVPLLFLSGAWMAAQLSRHLATGFALIAVFLLVSWPVQWTHWVATKDRNDRQLMLFVPIANHFPWPVRPVVAQWDAWQGWLIRHFVCMRHQEHKVATYLMVDRLPPRSEGEKVSWEERPTMSGSAVGVASWNFPNVAIIDTRGLNDLVVARHPVSTRSDDRQMAQDRRPPDGYEACFQPNVVLLPDGKIGVLPRPIPLTDDAIRGCESRDWEQPGGPG